MAYTQTLPWFKRLYLALKSDRKFFLMCLPGIVWLLLFAYLPMPGILLAFQRVSLATNNFFHNLVQPVRWVGLDNFMAYFQSPDFWNTTRNTLLYNITFIILGTCGAIFVAISASELWNKRAAKFFQTVMIFPAFLSWVIVSYLLFSLLDPQFGVINGILTGWGLDPVNWYGNRQAWPVILPLLNLWKGVGIGSIYYFAAITGIDTEIYESAQLDGVSRFKQILYITLPLLKPTIVVLTILGLGGIIRTDFGLFFVVTQQMGGGALYETVSTIDVYTYTLLMRSGRISLSAAVGLYQSVVGLATIIGVNMIVRKLDRDSAIF